MRITADNHQPLVTQYYPTEGQSEGVFDIVLVPSSTDDSSQTPETSADKQASVSPPTLFDTPWADREIFQVGLIDAQQAVLDQLPVASIYHIDLQITECHCDCDLTPLFETWVYDSASQP